MSIVRWEPLRDFMTLREAMDRLFEDSFVGRRSQEWLPAEGTLALDMSQTEDAAVIKRSVPGVKPDDIDITISGNTLTISGESKEEEEVKEEDYIRRERRYGSFSRSVVLPEGLEGRQGRSLIRGWHPHPLYPEGTRSQAEGDQGQGKEEVEYKRIEC